MKKALYFYRAFFVFGSPTWARTRDTWINSPLLYRLSYRGIGEGVIIKASSRLVNKNKSNLSIIF